MSRPAPGLARRHQSTLKSSTAVNATRTIPPRYGRLYDALSDLRKKAPAQVNQSRLQLALQGLESETPVTRVAVLGLNAQSTARRLVRLLLADALQDEEPWEKQLYTQGVDSAEGVLIRYGHPPNSSLPPQRTSTPILCIPSDVLDRNNMEILVSTIPGTNVGDLLHTSTPVSSDVFLSPSLGTPTAASGRQVTITQPVHSSLLVTSGLDEFLAAAQLLASTSFRTVEDRRSVSLAVNLTDTKEKSGAQVVLVDAGKAEQGLAAIRRSVSAATTYEHDWIDSGMPSLTQWLVSMSAANSAIKLSEPIRTLISSVLANASINIQTQAALEDRARQSQSLSTPTRTNLEKCIEEFSRHAHQELQSGLSSAWTSRNWRKLAWYKLFWRVDDVGLIITDLVSNAWLPRTERAVFELSGRLSEAGLSPIEATTVPREPPHGSADPAPVLQSHPALATGTPLQPVVSNAGGTIEVKMGAVDQPVPLSSSVSAVRTQQIDRAVTKLTSAAQQIVLKTLTLTGLSCGLSTLTYLSLTPGNWYEAGTIAAFGTAYALWRMQGEWLKATKALEAGLHDEGRSLIQRIVTRMKETVDDGGRVVPDEVEVTSRREAEEAIAHAREQMAVLEK